jgi:GH18 family chitinase
MDGVDPVCFAEGNRPRFAKSDVHFVVANNLDSADFDWKHPGADDIDGASPGSLVEGDNYLEFLRLVY